MTYLLQRFKQLFTKATDHDVYLNNSIKNITGQSPSNIDLYRLAISHTSVAKENEEGVKYSNERLEYLGDAVLGAIVADFLFKKYPFKDEGFLTEVRSRIVNRESLNDLGQKIGLNKIVEYSGSRYGRVSHKSLYGDALEALVGAIYLDKGYIKCKKFVLTVLLPHFNFDEIINSHKNFKSLLIEYVQRENKTIRFSIVDEIGNNHLKQFTAQVLIDEEPISTGSGFSKKKAEQAAAEKACELLKVV